MRLIDALVWQGFDSLGTPRKGEGVSKFRDKDETVIPARKRLIVRSLHPPVAPLKASGAFLTGKRAGEAAHPVFSAGRKHNGSAFIRGLASAEEIRTIRQHWKLSLREVKERSLHFAQARTNQS
jgi:hypothetical protein